MHLRRAEDLTPGVTAPSKTGNKNELTLSSTNHLSSITSVQLYQKTRTNTSDSIESCFQRTWALEGIFQVQYKLICICWLC